MLSGIARLTSYHKILRSIRPTSGKWDNVIDMTSPLSTTDLVLTPIASTFLSLILRLDILLSVLTGSRLFASMTITTPCSRRLRMIFMIGLLLTPNHLTMYMIICMTPLLDLFKVFQAIILIILTDFCTMHLLVATQFFSTAYLAPGLKVRLIGIDTGKVFRWVNCFALLTAFEAFRQNLSIVIWQMFAYLADRVVAIRGILVSVEVTQRSIIATSMTVLHSLGYNVHAVRVLSYRHASGYVSTAGAQSCVLSIA